MENKKELDNMFVGLGMLLNSVEELKKQIPESERELIDKELILKKEELQKQLKDLLNIKSKF